MNDAPRRLWGSLRRWWAMSCPRCHGAGDFLLLDSPRRVRIPCTYCSGRGTITRVDAWLEALGNAVSGAWGRR